MIAALRNEWRVLWRHPMVWIAVVASIMFGVATIGGHPTDPEEGAGAALLWLNMVFPMITLPFLAGALAPIFFLREVDHDMGEMFGSYPVTPRGWLKVRLVAMVSVILAASLLAQLVAIPILLRDFPGEASGLILDAIKWTFVLHLPNCLFWACLLAWIASRKAYSGLIYFTAGSIWLAYSALATISGSPLIAGSFVPFEPLEQAMYWLDPYGASSLMKTLPENGLFSSLPVNLLVSRLIWLGLAVVLVFSITSLPSRQSGKAEKPGQSGAAFLSNLSSPLGVHILYVVRDRVFPLLVLGWLALLLPEVVGGMDWVEPLSRVEPDSRDALNRVVWDLVPGAGVLILLYLADRICRLYSGTKMHELYAATAHSSAHLIMIQLLTTLLMALAFVALAGISVNCAQWLMGSPVQWGEYLQQLGLAFSQLALFACLFVALHALIRQRFLANLAGLLVMVAHFSPLLGALELHHPLWTPLSSVLARPDHYWGFGGAVAGHWHYWGFWAAIVAGALLIGIAFYHRTLSFMQWRFSTAMRQPFLSLAVFCLCAAGAQGTVIFQSLQSEGAVFSPYKRNLWRSIYERDYAHWAELAQPDIEAIKVWLDFSPEQQSAHFRADLTLLNRTQEPIAQVLVGRNQLHFAETTLSLEQAKEVRFDAKAGQRVFAFDRPLEPGGRATLTVDILMTQSNLRNASLPFVLRPKFNSIPAYVVLPIVGYRKELTLRSPQSRNEYGLPELELPDPSAISASQIPSLARDSVLVESIVSTQSGHQAIGQGALIKEWSEGGRAYFHFKTRQPIRALPVFFSVPWAKQSWSHGGVELQIYAPDKLSEENPNVVGMKDALDFLGKNIAPYQGEKLSMLAVPDIGFTGYALPQIIQMSHKFAFRSQPEDHSGFSQLYRRSVHETAHQWFGHRLGYGIPEERSFLVESLAKYSELVLIEKHYGPTAMQALVDYEAGRYRNAVRDTSREVLPLIDAGENYDQYSRATLVFSCLRKRIGDEPILAALRSSVEYVDRTGKPISSLQLVHRIKANADPAEADNVKQLLGGMQSVQRLLTSLNCQSL